MIVRQSLSLPSRALAEHLDRSDLALRLRQAEQDQAQARARCQEGHWSEALAAYDSACRTLGTTSPRRSWLNQARSAVQTVPEARRSAVCRLLTEVAEFYVAAPADIRRSMNAAVFHTLLRLAREDAVGTLWGTAAWALASDTHGEELFDSDRSGQAAWFVLTIGGDVERAAWYAAESDDSILAWQTRGITGLLQGDLVRVDEAAAALADSGIGHALAAASLYLQGLVTQSERQLRLAYKASADVLSRGFTVAVEGMLHTQAGEIDTAQTRLAQAIKLLAEAGQGSFLGHWAENMQAEMTGGTITPAVQTYSRFLRGQGLRIQALAARPDVALRLLAEALEAFDDLSPLESARTHLLRGRCRSRWGLPKAMDDYRLAAALLAPLRCTSDELQVMELLSVPL